MNAAELTEQDLDKSASQVFFAMQEALDNSQDTISPDPVGNWDIHNKNVVNLADGLKPDHAVNKKQLDAKDAKWDALNTRCDVVLDKAEGEAAEAEAQKNLAIKAAVDAQKQADYALEHEQGAKTQADRAHLEANRSETAKDNSYSSQVASQKLHDDTFKMMQQVQDQRDEIRVIRSNVESLANTSKAIRDDMLEKSSQILSDMTLKHDATVKAVTDYGNTTKAAMQVISDHVDKRKAEVDASANSVGQDKLQVKIWRDESEQFRDEASQAAGKATNYVVDYGTWMGAGKSELPPKPLTSARWRAVQGGVIPNVGTIRGGDFLYYSVKEDRFFIEGNITSVNGRNGEVVLTAADVGAVSSKGGTIEGNLLTTGNLTVRGNLTVSGNETEMANMDIQGELSEKGHRVYTDGRKPTAADVGAYSKPEADGRYQPKGSYAAAVHTHTPVQVGLSHYENASRSAYGSVTISGSKAGYAGIFFPDVNQTMMVNPAVQGFMHGGSWQWYFNNGVLTAGTVPWSRLTSLPATATRWPNAHEAGAYTQAECNTKYQPKGSYAAASHTHTWSQIHGLPATATRWPTWNEVSSKPSTMTPTVYTGTDSNATNFPIGTVLSALMARDMETNKAYLNDHFDLWLHKENFCVCVSDRWPNTAQRGAKLAGKWAYRHVVFPVFSACAGAFQRVS